MTSTIISLGGSLINPGELKIEYLIEFRRIIRSYFIRQHFFIFCGGGFLARQYAAGVKKFGGNNNSQDWIGIYASHFNARTVQLLFGRDAHEEIIIDPTKRVKTTKGVIVGGGWKPGWSTDYDAVQCAVTHNTKRVINLSNIDYLYDRDPRRTSQAKPIKKILWEELIKIIGTKWQPGLHVPFDPIAAKLAQKNNIEVIITNGRDLKNLRSILDGKHFKGTQISNND